jgi:hypothetical protein
MLVTPCAFNKDVVSNRHKLGVPLQTKFANAALMSHHVLLVPHVTLPGNALAASRTQSARAAQRHLTRKDQETNECAGR